MTHRRTTLGACCEIVSGATPDTSNPSYWGGDISWVTPKDLSTLHEKTISTTERHITQAGLASCATTLLPSGSVLFSSRAPIGHVAVNSVPMATNQGFKSFIPHADEIDAGYLYHWLRFRRSYLEGLGNGATFKEVSKAVIARVEILLPSLPEQRRIAEKLDWSDALRGKRRESIRLADDLLHSTFLEMVGPEAHRHRNWEVRPLESLAARNANAMRTGPFGSDLLHSEFVDNGVAVLGIDNAVRNRFSWDERRYITEEKYDHLRRYTVYPGDVLVTIMGTTGRSAVVPEDVPAAITTKHLATITVDRALAEPEFLSQSLVRHPDVLRQIAAANRGAIMAGLNLGLIKKLLLPVPPIECQREFAEAVAQIRQLADRLELGRCLVDSLWSSAMNQAFGDLTRAN